MVSLTSDRWALLRDQLLDAGLLKISHDGQFILGRDLYRYDLWQLCEQLQLTPAAFETGIAGTQNPWLRRCAALMTQLRDSNRETLRIPLATLFETDEADNPTTGDGHSADAATSEEQHAS